MKLKNLFRKRKVKKLILINELRKEQLIKLAGGATSVAMPPVRMQ